MSDPFSPARSPARIAAAGCLPGPPRRAPAPRAVALLLCGALLGGCAPSPEPATFAVPSAAAARIRMTCPPDTFIGTMTVNCPQPLPRADGADPTGSPHVVHVGCRPPVPASGAAAPRAVAIRGGPSGRLGGAAQRFLKVRGAV